MFARRHTIRFVAILAGALLGISLAAPIAGAAQSYMGRPGGPAASSTTIGIVLPAKNSRWLQDAARFTSLLNGSGYTYQILFSQEDPDVERTNVETLISKGMRVLILCPVESDGASAAVAEARAAGAKVISYDRLILNTAAVDYYITFDGKAVGRAQGQYLIDHAGGSGRPLYLYAGHPGDNNSFVFFEGSWEILQPKIANGTFSIKNSSAAVALQGHPTLTHAEEASILDQITTEWDASVAQALAKANLSAVTPADKGHVSILAPNDDTGRAIGDVFAADPQITSYVITGQDAVKASVQYIIDGKQSMTVFKDTRTLAADAVTAAVTYLHGGTPAADTTTNNGVINVPSHFSAVVSVDKYNLKPVLIDSGYYSLSDFKWPVVSAVITSAGGDLTSQFDSTAYDFAWGTFDQSVLVTHAVTFASTYPDHLGGIGHSFDLSATYSANGQPAEPGKPYTIIVQYADSQTGVVDVNTLALYYWDDGGWVKEPTSAVSVSSRTVTATPNHFSSWILMGEIHRIFLPVAVR
jgi:putative multiple sugar transport system substrate-binding protein